MIDNRPPEVVEKRYTRRSIPLSVVPSTERSIIRSLCRFLHGVRPLASERHWIGTFTIDSTNDIGK